MIAALRRRHRVMFAVLAPTVLASVVVAVGARPDRPASSVTPRELLGQLPQDLSPEPAYRLTSGLAFGAELRVGVDVAFGADPRGSRFVDVSPHGDPALPDVLVYAADPSAGGDGLPGDAVLLGTLAGAAPLRFALPDGLPEEPLILLYSLGDQQIVGASLVTVREG